MKIRLLAVRVRENVARPSDLRGVAEGLCDDRQSSILMTVAVIQMYT
jgi:hypothetical protein